MMIKNMSVADCVRSNQFVREPVDKIIHQIEDSSSKKILLTGGRGCGKSTVLYHQENQNLGRENPFFATRFDSVGVCSDRNVFDEKFMRHYYELILSNNFLLWIRNYYGLTFEEYFSTSKKEISSLIEEMDDYINHVYYDEVSLTKLYDTGECMEDFIQKFKNILGCSELSLMIDRFDWTNNSDFLVQEILSGYFPFFDKVVLTCDDEEIQKEERQLDLKKKGFSFVPVSYGKDLKVLKTILKKRLEAYEKTATGNDISFSSYISDDMYQQLIDLTDGNISLAFSIINSLKELKDWDHEICVSEQLPKVAQEEIEHTKKLKKMGLSSKIYL